LPKGLLSPTNNIKNNKHAHYFESDNNGDFGIQQSIPLSFIQKANTKTGKSNSTAITTNAGGTVININIENSGCNHNPYSN
jgi:hypothetical protein